jgi:hypothetical protein
MAFTFFVCATNSLYFLLLLQKKVAKKSRADFDAEPFLSLTITQPKSALMR